MPPAPIGNTYSSKNNRLLTDTLRRVALSGDGEKVRAVCEQVFEKAVAGDLTAAAFIFDRLEGKPLQTIEANLNMNHPECVKRAQELLSASGPAAPTDSPLEG